ncbi:MAG: D-alanyl-D-alanine carboxypeptidase family protein [Prosthecobacter sp.]
MMTTRTFVLFAGLAVASHAAEDLAAPPVTTCKAWAIADGKTGEILASHHPDEPLKSASTTKAMCAHVILELAKKDPAVLEEIVTISKLADATPGSTAEVTAGEKVTVRDGLYGMLLPSGNDMGNAFAEHFNARLAPPAKDAPASILKPEFRTRSHFIAEMNRTAARLGMTRTVYRQSFGDGGTDADRTTTAADLLKLGHAAMQNPLFRDIVKTQQHTGKVSQPNGKERSIEWKNSNKLLALGGYDGIKTGMTKSAGYCLLARGEQDGVQLVVAVLGGVTEETRNADVRNLFRWQWGMRSK